MPRINRETTVFTYVGFLKKINSDLKEKYGSITKFLNSEDYKRCGLESENPKKIAGYLSVPKDGNDKKVKSTPVSQKIAKFLGYDIEVKIKVEKTVTIYLN